MIELLKEDERLAQNSAEYGIHANVLHDWRIQTLKGLPSLFERRDDVAELKAAHAEQVVSALIDRTARAIDCAITSRMRSPASAVPWAALPA